MATQAGEIGSRWGWVEPSVWTAWMLAALEEGVKGGKWHSLNHSSRSSDPDT
jgi:hypothetical protein